MKTYLITQNAGYFLDNKKNSVWLNSNDFNKIKSCKKISFMLYDKRAKRVYGEYVPDMSLSVKSEDGHIAIPITKITRQRRGAYYFLEKKIGDFEACILKEDDASLIREKLTYIQNTPEPSLLSLRYKDGIFSYKYTEMFKSVFMLEDSFAISEKVLLSFTKEYNNIMRNSNEASKRDELIEIGKNILHTLFPDSGIREAFLEEGKIIYIDADCLTSTIPFECMADFGSFISEKSIFSFGMSANRLIGGFKFSRPLKVSVINIEHNDLFGGEKEVEIISSLFEDKKNVCLKVIGGKLNYISFRKIMEESDILHIITHGVEIEEGGNGWLISNDEIVCGNDVRSFSSPPALIFAHTCESAYAPIGDTRYIVSSLLKAGVGNVIASSASTSDNAPKSFLSEFYGSLSSGESVLTSYKNAIFTEKTGLPFLRFRFFGTHNLRFPKR